MANKLQYQYHAGNPAAQPFNVGPRKNKTKQRSWWSSASPSYWCKAKQDGKAAAKTDAKAAV